MSNLEYFMSEIKKVVECSPIKIRGGVYYSSRRWEGTFNIGDFEEAVHNQLTIMQMRRFLKGKISWYMEGGNSLKDADMKARSDIGFVFRELSIWRRFKWWMSCGVTRSNKCYA